MNQSQKISTNNSSVAWFKIANLIERKEREKALSVYKLMVHSLPDRAYALQLEGDILLSFEDISAACEKYMQAAYSYRNATRWLDAAAIYEHVQLLNPENIETLIYSIPCYAQLGWENKFNYNLEQISVAISKNTLDDKFVINAMRGLAESSKEIDDAKLKVALGTRLSQILSKLPSHITEKLEPLLKKYF